MGQYPPGSTFKTTQALTYLSEGIITPGTAFPCHHGFSYKGLHVGCHGHPSPIALVDAISTSCNGYFCCGSTQVGYLERSQVDLTLTDGDTDDGKSIP